MSDSRVSFEMLQAFVTDAFKSIGVPEQEAVICAEVIVESDKRGVDSHGVGRFKPIYYDRVREGIQSPITNFEIVRDNKATAVVDGNNGMGMVIAKRCMEMAIKKAQEHGLGMVVARNSTHYGFAAYYPLMAVKEDMIGLTGTNARPSVAPTYGVENMLGTNPLVFAMPTDEDFPFTNDYATSIIQRGKIEQYAREGKSVPVGLVIDQNGKTETDSLAILEHLTKGTSALAPLGGVSEETGGHKGYGFATVVEILTAALAQGAFLKQLSGKDAEGNNIPIPISHFFLALDVACFADLDDFKKTCGDILRALRSSKKAAGVERIYTCGEKEYLVWQERKDKGLPLSLALKKNLVDIRNELGLDYVFPFE